MDGGVGGVVVLAGPGAGGLGVGGPGDGEDLRTPDGLSEAAIGGTGGAVDETGEVGEAHFGGVVGRGLGLLGGGIAEASSGGVAVPEVASVEAVLGGVIVQDGGGGRVGIAGRLAIAGAGTDRSGIGTGGFVQGRDGAGEAGFGHVAEGTGFVTFDGEVFVCLLYTSPSPRD